MQEALNRALSTLLREEIQVVGAGRTDTGVHASFYVAHFDTCQSLEYPEQTVYKLNRILGKDIAVSRIYPVATDKHARFSAVSRTYQYFIDKNKNPFTCEYAWKVYPLPDIRLMNEACQVLFEYRDFTSFSKLHTDVKTNICRVSYARWERLGEHEWVFVITADRFLRNMVRAVVGTLVDVSRGKRAIGQFREVIDRRYRCAAGTSMPGEALFLWEVRY